MVSIGRQVYSKRMRLAIFADIHGNSIALDAVLADIAGQGGVDGYWVLGDLAAIGPDPVGVLERLAALENVICTRGNTDRYVISGERPPPTAEEAMADPRLVAQYGEVQATFAWTAGAITAAGWRAWLAALPLEQTLVLPDGSRLLGVHAAPGKDDGFFFYPSIPEGTMRQALEGCQADVIAVGHSHFPLDVQIGSWRVINSGGVSNPLPPDLGAKYILLEAGGGGYRVERRSVDYDREAVMAQLEALRHPGRRFVIEHLRGEFVPDWHRPYAGLS